MAYIFLFFEFAHPRISIKSVFANLRSHFEMNFCASSSSLDLELNPFQKYEKVNNESVLTDERGSSLRIGAT